MGTTGTVVETRGRTEATARITGTTTTTGGQGPARDGRTTGQVSVPPLLSQSLTTVREAVVLRRSCQSAWTSAPQNHSTSSKPASRGVPRGAEKKLCLPPLIFYTQSKNHQYYYNIKIQHSASTVGHSAIKVSTRIPPTFML